MQNKTGFAMFWMEPHDSFFPLVLSVLIHICQICRWYYHHILREIIDIISTLLKCSDTSASATLCRHWTALVREEEQSKSRPSWHAITNWSVLWKSWHAITYWSAGAEFYEKVYKQSHWWKRNIFTFTLFSGKSGTFSQCNNRGEIC